MNQTGMNMLRTMLCALLVLTVIPSEIRTQSSSHREGSAESVTLRRNAADDPCITPEEYNEVRRRCDEHSASLDLSTGSQQHSMITFQWPLRASAALKDYSYYLITNYVDTDTVKGSVQDYHCGKTTYDGHNGTDIVIWPFTMYKMDYNQVEVIAAAPGIIIDKKDGFYDKNCVTNNGGTNYVIVQHSDGSRAYYWHLKKSSLTAKAIGQSVTAGEFLAVVGSSGSSSIPHLHFEVMSGDSPPRLIDPYAGACNPYNAASWWTEQRTYTEPAIVKLSLHSVKPVFPACPATETPNEKNVFPSVQFGEALFYSYTRSESLGMSAQYRIVNPDGSTFSSWSSTSTTNFNATIRYWLKLLPGEPGNYLFEGTLNGITTSVPFQITGTSSVAQQAPISAARVFPNPTGGALTFDWGSEEPVNSGRMIEVYNTLGAVVHRFSPSGRSTVLNLSLPSGVYFLRMTSEQTRTFLGKFIITSSGR